MRIQAQDSLNGLHSQAQEARPTTGRRSSPTNPRTRISRRETPAQNPLDRAFLGFPLSPPSGQLYPQPYRRRRTPRRTRAAQPRRHGRAGGTHVLRRGRSSVRRLPPHEANGTYSTRSLTRSPPSANPLSGIRDFTGSICLEWHGELDI